MNSNHFRPVNSAPQHESGEETLRLIATLPAPEGLEERVHHTLRSAPRSARVLGWPGRRRASKLLAHPWTRTAAAAAIVFVVVGGGWGVYSRVEKSQPGKVLVMPAPAATTAGFSGAGAIRTPQTLPGPTVRAPETKAAGEQGAPPEKKPMAPTKNVKAHTASPSAVLRLAPQPTPGAALAK